MKTFFVALLFAVPICAFTQTERFEVNETSFVTKKGIEKNEWGMQDTVLYLYRVENGRPEYLLKHYLYQDEGGDCNNRFWAKGTYTREGNRLLFVTQHLQQRHDPIVEWERQEYKVTPNGHLARVSAWYKMVGDSDWKELHSSE